MASEVAHVADSDGQILPGLPLNIKSLVQRVREFICPVVICKRKERQPLLYERSVGQRNCRRIARGRSLQHCAPRIGERATPVCCLRRVTRRNKELVEVSYSAANLRIDEWRSLVDAEGAPRDHARGKAWRQICEQLAAVVVHAPTAAHDNLVVEHFGAPRYTYPCSEAPFPSLDLTITHSFA